ncbi:hypothetical protein [uncultured Parvimonas sp.]|nr:hypothetical protein [uncultured Parvimonas sp.]
MSIRSLIRLIFDSLFTTSALLCVWRIILLPLTSECDDDEQ